MTYGHYKTRQIEKQEADSLVPLGEGRLLASSPDFPEIGRDVLRLTGNKDLTYSQLRELCETPVANAQGVYPAPQKEREAHPLAWAEFVKNIPKMQWYLKVVVEQHRRLTNGLVIDFMRGYASPGGWLRYRPELSEQMPDPSKDVDSWW